MFELMRDHMTLPRGQIVQVESSQTLIKGIAGTVQATEGLWHCQNKRKTRKAILFDAHGYPGVSGGITGQGIVHAVSHVFCTQAASFPTPFLFLLPAPFSLPPDIPDKRRVLLRRPGGDDEGLNDGVPVRYELPTSKAARNPQLKAQSRTTEAPKFADKMFHFDAQMNFSFQICSRSLGKSIITAMGGSSFSLHWGAPTNWNFLKECTLRILPAATTPPPPSLYRLTYHFPGLAPIWAAQNETGVGFINPETKVPVGTGVASNIWQAATALNIKENETEDYEKPIADHDYDMTRDSNSSCWRAPLTKAHGKVAFLTARGHELGG
ncbi:hypothetical protein C0Q70_08822 [Pomacea canaliculata]|uniref:Uncharacterized protein n=1 Tax=Pomacea canaliculata TaxID=400727 RepID=A0A2T7P823_POMCA|nr:hypothetical protein C0Q70_08822 [Pomacea canaliculata]